MERTQKIWGERWLLRQDSTHATSYLRLRKHTRCSLHRHQAKSNLFVVIRGKVGIKTCHGEIILGPGQEFTVEPDMPHDFRAYEDSEMIEEMFVEYREQDIDRYVVGSEFVP